MPIVAVGRPSVQSTVGTLFAVVAVVAVVADEHAVLLQRGQARDAGLELGVGDREPQPRRLGDHGLFLDHLLDDPLLDAELLADPRRWQFDLNLIALLAGAPLSSNGKWLGRTFDIYAGGIVGKTVIKMDDFCIVGVTRLSDGDAIKRALPKRLIKNL